VPKLREPRDLGARACRDGTTSIRRGGSVDKNSGMKKGSVWEASEMSGLIQKS